MTEGAAEYPDLVCLLIGLVHLFAQWLHCSSPFYKCVIQSIDFVSYIDSFLSEEQESDLLFSLVFLSTILIGRAVPITSLLSLWTHVLQLFPKLWY